MLIDKFIKDYYKAERVAKGTELYRNINSVDYTLLAEKYECSEENIKRCAVSLVCYDVIKALKVMCISTFDDITSSSSYIRANYILDTHPELSSYKPVFENSDDHDDDLFLYCVKWHYFLLGTSRSKTGIYDLDFLNNNKVIRGHGIHKQTEAAADVFLELDRFKISDISVELKSDKAKLLELRNK